jgi:MFS family permease
MSAANRMSAPEVRAVVALSAVYGLRMFGMFVILPVFAIYAQHLRDGADVTLVGIAIGAYGLTQALLQIPFGWLSDRYGRKPVIYFGLFVFAVGSFVAAGADSIYGVIVGRMLQGAGAISAAVIALTADLTSDEHRTKAMALIGSMIGLTFALSLVVSPWLNHLIGVPGIFALTGVLALLAIGFVHSVVPAPPPPVPRAAVASRLPALFMNPQLARLNYGVFAIHAVLMALFIVVPLALQDDGLSVETHWRIYLPVMLLSFLPMWPALIAAERKGRVKAVTIAAVAVLLAAQLAMPWLLGSTTAIVVFLLVFFSAFNVLEAILPSLTSKLAPPDARGSAAGIFSSVQFLGTFTGAAGGGFLYHHYGAPGSIAFGAVLLAIWLLLALGMQAPRMLRTFRFDIPPLDAAAADALQARLATQPGVREATVAAGMRVVQLRVDVAGFDEQHVIRLLAERT